MPNDYNHTLNLPVTDFPMRGSLPEREPAMLQRWYDEDIYGKLMEKNSGRPRYILHDGPPYANGDIHIGHALNKSLKDFIVRYKNLAGFYSPYVPGWDTHGLPIELKAMKKLGAQNLSDPVLLRKHCREFAEHYVAVQREQFKRLGVIGDWENPYLTLAPEFEARQIEIFGEMAKKGYIYKGLKPVYWCPTCVTALAEAEIEYAEDPCYSIYVKFQLKDDQNVLKAKGIDPVKAYFVIWTTTTWTLPGNVAICLGAEYDYAAVQAGDEVYIVAEALVENAMKAANIGQYDIIARFKGSELEHCTVHHPFLDRESLVILGDHVTLESGTGCVHTAPGHGVEDFQVGQQYKLPVVVPVDENGVLTEEAGPFCGLTTETSGKVIAEHLEKSGHLFAVEKITHQYPHCWRCKDPVIFRATEQWFCSVSDFTPQVLEEVAKIKWIPAWGEERMADMVRGRTDWCISRQRRWGVPIPIFYCDDCGEYIVNNETIEKVIRLCREKGGSDAWYQTSERDILGADFRCPHCGGSSLRKEQDIMDVWFDSGTSHASVLCDREELEWPADLYLEGNDQFRGWFQSALLTAVAWKGKAPYRGVCTHGFLVDSDGNKQSKSMGNVNAPEEIIGVYGADVLRLWVASADYHSDIRIGQDLLKQMAEIYRKIRNTARFILGNLSDFDPDCDRVPTEEMQGLDRWALRRLAEVILKCRQSYDDFDFYLIFHAVHNFCVVDLSNFYLDIIKDRLYVERADSPTRRAAQTAIYDILRALAIALAPILAFTADEIWQAMRHGAGDDARHVMLNDFPEVPEVPFSDAEAAEWKLILSVRDDVKKALEEARAKKEIGSSLEAKVSLTAEGELYRDLAAIPNLAELFIVSAVELREGAVGESAGMPGLAVSVERAPGHKCQRCWSFSPSVSESSGELCDRCADIVAGL